MGKVLLSGGVANELDLFLEGLGGTDHLRIFNDVLELDLGVFINSLLDFLLNDNLELIVLLIEGWLLLRMMDMGHCRSEQAWLLHIGISIGHADTGASIRRRAPHSLGKKWTRGGEVESRVGICTGHTRF